MRLFKSILLTVFCAGFVVGCGRIESQRPENAGVRRVASAVTHEYMPTIGTYGGTVNLAILGDPKSFNPITAKETSTTQVTGFMFVGLMGTNGITLQPQQELAESYAVSDDGRVYTFRLREGLQWSDGQPLTADDVIFTFQLIFDPDIVTSSKDSFTIGGRRKSLEGEQYKALLEPGRAVLKMEEGADLVVEKVDRLTVRFRLPAPFAPFLMAASEQIMPRHYLEKVWKAGDFSSSLSVSTAPEEIVCSGPFTLAGYRAGERVRLVRNPRYWKLDASGNRLPYLDGVTLIVASQDLMTLKFEAGEIDYIGMRGSDFPKLKRLEEKTGDFSIIDTGPRTSSSFIIFNQNPGRDAKTGKPFIKPNKLRWFRDVRFRQAVAHAIDKDGIIDIVMNGFGYPQWGPSTPSRGYFHNPNVPRFEYNLGRAQAILKAMGFVDRDLDGFLEDADGQPLEFSLITNAGNKVREKIAVIVRKDLERIGVRVHFSLVEFNTITNKLDNPPYDWEAIILGLTGGPEPHFGQNVWKSRGPLHMWYPRQEEPSTAWEAEIDEIYEKGSITIDRRERKKLYDRWQVIAARQLPFIYTVTDADLVAVRDRFENLFPTPLGGVFHNIEEVYLKEK